jgi:hypothetical protein
VGVFLGRETETETEINMASFELPEFVGNGILKDHMDTLLADGWDDVPTLKMMSPNDMDLLHLTQLQRVSNLSLSLCVSQTLFFSHFLIFCSICLLLSFILFWYFFFQVLICFVDDHGTMPGFANQLWNILYGEIFVY